MNAGSYTAANGFPWKLIQHPRAITEQGNQRTVVPVHIQLIPTNRCNGNCSFCSCRNEDRKLELGIEELHNIIQYFASLGTEAITITGGGEPTIHPDIEELLLSCQDVGMEIGLVTNGKLWGAGEVKLQIPNQTLTWVRVSVTDTLGAYDCGVIEQLAKNLPDVDVGISFTVCRSVNMATAIKVCKIAEEQENITHVRFVSDITDSSRAGLALEKVESECNKCTKAIFQYRDEPKSGVPVCHISKLKPVIHADGYIYPCCGAQYAISLSDRKMPESMRMCKWGGFAFAEPFDGSVCNICFYRDYQVALGHLLQHFEHRKHV